ncbi:peroxiredoxin Q/BCP [Gillisia mitskevichiae]|uniref:thioredoxin-dependent peroxiredoxin n=2 Tax=Gillisia mitskevichiae TaxID=270921 RepID=A0A495PU15_9FLAO|nr:peroxiredoxin Q/BCP [Gillisia mitskevichiae]
MAKIRIMIKLKVGDTAPEFSVKDQDGNTISLKDYKGKKVVLFFYPKASTPGCTAEACNLRDNWEQFQEKGYQILGASADSEKRQSNFKNKYDLPFPLLADEDKEVIEAYGVWGPKKFMGKEYEGINRTTFIIDENGLIEEIITKVKTKDHTSQILQS